MSKAPSKIVSFGLKVEVQEPTLPPTPVMMSKFRQGQSLIYSSKLPVPGTP